jgi:rhodanese-related sulfurtransferase
MQILGIATAVLFVLVQGSSIAAKQQNSQCLGSFDFGTISSDIEKRHTFRGKIRLSSNIPDEWMTRRLKKRDPALVVSAESVLKEPKTKPEAILIDVRPKAEFEKLRIPGSLNIDLFAVKTKTFLQSKPLVLIGEGYRYRELEEETRLLRKAGFTEKSTSP